MTDVLGERGWSEIGFAIVETIVIDVVGETAGRDIDDEMMHILVLSFPVPAGSEGADGIPGMD